MPDPDAPPPIDPPKPDYDPGRPLPEFDPGPEPMEDPPTAPPIEPGDDRPYA